VAITFFTTVGVAIRFAMGGRSARDTRFTLVPIAALAITTTCFVGVVTTIYAAAVAVTSFTIAGVAIWYAFALFL
jgi:hypothetical protein